MKQLKDLSKEQIIEIVNLVYPFKDYIKSEIDVKYQPYDESLLDDAQEYWFAKFDGITFADKVDTYRLWIYPTLNLEFDAIRTNVKNMSDKQKKEAIGDCVLLGSFPVRNQHLIQKKFMEWNIKPVFKNYNS